MDKETADKVTNLLNELLQKQGEGAGETNRKLDSILSFLQTNVNPNRLVVTYDCAGSRFTKGQTAEAVMDVNADYGAKTEDLKKMAELSNAGKYKELVDLCTQEMKSAPEWLTPYLLCSLGHNTLHHNDEAKRLLVYYEQHTGPAYQDNAECKRLADHLHEVLRP